MLENETELDACMRVCLANLTATTEPVEVSTETAYIEGATARKLKLNSKLIFFSKLMSSNNGNFFHEKISKHRVFNSQFIFLLTDFCRFTYFLDRSDFLRTFLSD